MKIYKNSPQGARHNYKDGAENNLKKEAQKPEAVRDFDNIYKRR